MADSSENRTGPVQQQQQQQQLSSSAQDGQNRTPFYFPRPPPRRHIRGPGTVPKGATGDRCKDRPSTHRSGRLPFRQRSSRLVSTANRAWVERLALSSGWPLSRMNRVEIESRSWPLLSEAKRIPNLQVPFAEACRTTSIALVLSADKSSFLFGHEPNLSSHQIMLLLALESGRVHQSGQDRVSTGRATPLAGANNPGEADKKNSRSRSLRACPLERGKTKSASPA